MMIKCLLVDDEPLALDALEFLIQKIPELEIIDRCSNAVDALQVINNKQIDLLLLDIQMPEITGIEMLKSLAHPPKVIFTTAYRDYAVEAFELDVIDYLVKPISLERLIRSINRYHDRISRKPGPKASDSESSNKTITIYSDKKNYRVITSSILYVEGLKDYAMVGLENNFGNPDEDLKKIMTALGCPCSVPFASLVIIPSVKLDPVTLEIADGKTPSNSKPKPLL